MFNNNAKKKNRQYLKRSNEHAGELLFTRVYDYKDEDGNVIFQVVREQYEKGKHIYQRRPGKDGEWIKNLKNIKPTIYRLPEIIKAVKNGKTIFIVEGEKDADTLVEMGLQATTNPMGVFKWKKEYNKHLKDADVVIIPDNDDVGKKHALKIAEGLMGMALSLKVVELPRLDESEDVTDWVENYDGTKEELLELVKKEPEYKDTFKGGRILLVLDKNPENSPSGNAEKVFRALDKLDNIYWRNGLPEKGLGRVLYDHDNNPSFCIMDEGIIYNELCKVAIGDNPKGLPPREMAKFIYGLSAQEVPVKPLDRIVRMPIFTALKKMPDGTERSSLIKEAGYHKEARILYIPPNEKNLYIPEKPTKKDIRRAKNLIENDLLVNFEFKTDADKTHAIAYILLFFCREMIDGPTPMHVFTAAKQGTGKTLLAEAIMKNLSLGNYVLYPAPTSEDEIRKKISTSLNETSVTGFLLDNVTSLKSSTLASAILAGQYSDRVLGELKGLTKLIKWVWAATGNNIDIDTDMVRRCIRIRLRADHPNPHLRPLDQFKHPFLHRWCEENRDQILWSGLILVQAWVAAGQPYIHNGNLGGFENWSRVIGSILAFHEYHGFLGNIKEFQEEADQETSSWCAFLQHWWDNHKENRVTSADLLNLAEKVEDFNLGRSEREEGKKAYLSKYLNTKKDTVNEIFEPKKALKLTKEPRGKNGIFWKLTDITDKLEKDKNAKKSVEINNFTEKEKNSGSDDGVDEKLIDTTINTLPNDCNKTFKLAEKPYTASEFIELDNEKAAKKDLKTDAGDDGVDDSYCLRALKDESKHNSTEGQNHHHYQHHNELEHIEKPVTAGVLGIPTRGTMENDLLAGNISLSELSRRISGKNVSIDLETTGLDVHRDKICVLSIACGDDYWIVQNPTKYLFEDVINNAGLLIGHNLKFDLGFIRKVLKKRIKPNIFDTMLAAQLIEGNTNNTTKGYYSLQQTAERYLGITIDKTMQTSNWGGTITPLQIKYCINDVKVPLKLYPIQLDLIEKNKLQQVSELEFRCVPAVVEMELNGISINVAETQELHGEVSAIDVGSFGFNPNSEQQIKGYFDSIGIKLPNTQKESLIMLDHPVAKQILAHKDKKKQLEFLTIWLNLHENGRLYPSFRQIGAATGRFSCFDPNLQQVPRENNFRKLFVAPEGYRLVDCDLSGIELRIMAWLSKDPTMLKAFRENQDLHRITASKVLSKPPEEITKSSPERQLAKAVNFGLIYGAGAKKLQNYAKDNYGVDMSLEEAKKAREIFFETYPGIKKYHWEIMHKKSETYCLPGGEAQKIVVRCASGRARIFDPEDVRFTQAVNHPDQGTGADMIKEALIHLYMDTNYRIILTVHDEIMLEVPKNEAQQAKDALRQIMIEAGSKYILPVPVDAEVGIGDTWADCK